MDVMGIIRSRGVSSTRNPAYVDRLKAVRRLLVEDYRYPGSELGIEFAELLRVRPSEAVRAVLRIIYTSNVFCPQPLEALGIEVVLQDDHNRRPISCGNSNGRSPLLPAPGSSIFRSFEVGP